MTHPQSAPGEAPSRPRRSDAQRNQQALLEAAAEVFTKSGVDAPTRTIATKAGVGVGTIYRHFPSRADLVMAVYQKQVEQCGAAGRELLSRGGSRFAALQEWTSLFTEFLVTKHGLAEMLRPDDPKFRDLHASMLEELVPVCAGLLNVAAHAGEIRGGVQAYEFLRGIGNLCIGAHDDPEYDPRRLIEILLAGLHQAP